MLPWRTPQGALSGLRLRYPVPVPLHSPGTGRPRGEALDEDQAFSCAFREALRGTLLGAFGEPPTKGDPVPYWALWSSGPMAQWCSAKCGGGAAKRDPVRVGRHSP